MATTTLEAFKKELNPAVVEQAEKQAFELLKEMTLADLRKHKRHPPGRPGGGAEHQTTQHLPNRKTGGHQPFHPGFLYPGFGR